MCVCRWIFDISCLEARPPNRHRLQLAPVCSPTGRTLAMRRSRSISTTASHTSIQLFTKPAHSFNQQQQHLIKHSEHQSPTLFTNPFKPPTTTNIITMFFSKTIAIAIMATVAGANAAAAPPMPQREPVQVRPAAPVRPVAPQFNMQTINCGGGASRKTRSVLFLFP